MVAPPVNIYPVSETPKPWYETKGSGKIVLNLPFDNGTWIKLVLAQEGIPNFIDWLGSDDEGKVWCARCYIAAIEGCPISRSEFDAMQARRREKRWQEML